MAATGRSSASSVLRPLSSSSHRLLNHSHNHNHNHDHHHQRSASPCNLNLCLKRVSPANTPKPSVAVSSQKIKCLCSPTTHPGSFRCSFHRRLENEKNGTLGSSSAKRNTCGNTTRNSALNLRKAALVNSLAKIGSVEAERFRKSLAATMVKPNSSLHTRRRNEFRPRPSRFYALHKDQD
ncbi:hypothetical protein EUTSA_v10015868mg [Eutrema salsugineum]|uniref:Serine-rich protein-like protein n=1 Tax=Eutrema salsugineum TaxID=72664 RepID=V4LQF3_EUTSA|nr:uncharacterized protein LOC18018454 [Eutrema salsugineum]ESQ42058.1 hypothetical protein EUTSA_v10015868mg [Eutrema salsugineum]